jgi:hypothetical protein
MRNTQRTQFPFIHYFIHLFIIIFSLTTGPQHIPKRVLRRVRSSASSFNLEYPLSSLSSVMKTNYGEISFLLQSMFFVEIK